MANPAIKPIKLLHLYWGCGNGYLFSEGLQLKKSLFFFGQIASEVLLVFFFNL